jgi:UDP-glucose 4-epimerase
MNILVTGGAGFIGSNLVKQLIEDGHQVTVIDNLLSGYEINLEGLNVKSFIKDDIRNENAIDLAMKDVQIVFHLAASVGNKRSIDLPHDDSDINVIGTIRVLEAARKHGVKKIVTSSSAGTFGELKTLPIDENHPQEPITPYGVSKLAKEKMCFAYQDLYGIEAVCLRYFNVYGPNQRFDAYGNVIPIFVFKMLAGDQLTIFGDGEQTRDFVNSADVVQANIRSALTPGVTGVFNIGSGTSITINHLVELLEKASDIKPDFIHGPERPGDVRDSKADISKARKAFAYNPGQDMLPRLITYCDWAKEEFKRSGPPH